MPLTGIGFQGEFLDFERGIRVGNLDPHERITRILKLALESRYRQEFVTERWGRGVYWQWIGYLNRANRAAKPLSNHVSFGCSKFFVMVNTEDKLFKCGLQVERGYLQAPPEYRECELKPDWDWHRLLKALTPRRVPLGGARDKPSTSSKLAVAPIERELKRLLREGFWIHAGSWEEEPARFSQENYPGAGRLKRLLVEAPGRRWCGFQVYWAMGPEEVAGGTGVELVEAMLAVFEEVRPLMNLCLQIPLE